MKKHLKYACAIVLVILLFTITISAHSGKTDSYGGHYDNSSGEYHYHHGYPAHDHYDMDGDGDIDCPYDFKDNTSHSNSSKNNNKSETNKPEANSKPSNKLTFGDIVVMILKIIGISSLVLLLGCSILYLIFHLFLNQLIIWFCKKILKKDISESTCSKISIVSSIAVVVTIVSIIVLSNEGII